MQHPRDNLAPRKMTHSQLKEFDRSDLSKPIYVSIKGTVFDVSAKADVYGASGCRALKAEHAVPDYSALTTANRKVLDDWHAFFTKRYNIVGQVTDLPQHASGKEDAPADMAANLW
ncbi:hypothetical protein C8R44DRAFT_881422 [Mycena epipterygia]|nr:hypothetical protein C8R44DRAFT_881422 [Mycena epipterygia]